VIHFNVTANPTAAWTAQRIVRAFPDPDPPRYLLRGRDGVYGHAFCSRVSRGSASRKSSPRLEAHWRTVSRRVSFAPILLGEMRVNSDISGLLGRTAPAPGRDTRAETSVMVSCGEDDVSDPRLGRTPLSLLCVSCYIYVWRAERPPPEPAGARIAWMIRGTGPGRQAGGTESGERGRAGSSTEAAREARRLQRRCA
jgi:hypothetical protein